MSDLSLIDYLSIVDPGHASVIWPYKDERQARGHKAYMNQIERVIRFNLLWRRSVAFRHIDLFNNIALMRFMNSDDASILCATDSLKVTIPNSDSLEENFHRWALEGKQSQHYHHLSQERQERYDRDFALGKMTFEKLQEHLDLEFLNIDLGRTIRNYDKNFARHNRAVLRHAPEAKLYSKGVLQHWNHMLMQNRQLTLSDGRQLDAISKLFTNGVLDEWRRKQFFTELEALEKTFHSEDATNPFALAKVGAINQAFYDELEEFRFEDESSPAPVAVSRDIAYLSKDVESHTDSIVSNRPAGWRIQAFDDIPLIEIARWHSGEDAASEVFVKSVNIIQRALREPAGSLSDRYVKNLIEDHIKAINACIDQAVRDKHIRKIINTESWIEAYVPHHTNLAMAGASATISILGSAVSAASHLPHAVNFFASAAFTLVGGAVSVGLQHKRKNREWSTAECTLKSHIDKKLRSNEL